MIKKPNELDFENEKFNILIAGFPGCGKTTLGCSAPKPLLIDLDKGISRVNAKFRQDVDEVDTYEELLDDLQKADLSCYETIVIDTGARLLDLMKDWAIRKNAQNGQTDGNLTLKGYGVVGKEFMRFVNSIKYKYNKHCVVIFHCQEVKDNDLMKLRITIEGQSKDNIWQPMDLGGFVEIVNKKHIIGFTPNERYFAKGSHGIKGVYELPNPDDTGINDFLTKIITTMNETLKNEAEKAKEERKEYERIMDNVGGLIEKMTEKNITNVQDAIKNTNHISTTEKELKHLFLKKLDELGMIWDKVAKKYVKKVEENTKNETEKPLEEKVESEIKNEK